MLALLLPSACISASGIPTGDPCPLSPCFPLTSFIHLRAQSDLGVPSCWRTTTWLRSWPSLTARGSQSVSCMRVEQWPRDSSRCGGDDRGKEEDAVDGGGCGKRMRAV